MRGGAHSRVLTQGVAAQGVRRRGKVRDSFLFPCPWGPGLTAGQDFSWGGAKEAPQAGEQGLGYRAILLQASGERTREKHEVVQAQGRQDGADAPGGQLPP